MIDLFLLRTFFSIVILAIKAMLCSNVSVKNVVEGWLLKTSKKDNELLTMGPFNTLPT
jgi:hypothetical protein